MLEVMASHASLWFCALAHSIPIHRASCRPYHRRHRGWAVGQGHLLQALSHPPRWHDEDHGRRHGHHPAANGAMTKNLNKGIGKIKYDNFGHMEEIIFDNSNSTSYVYAADGTKLRVSHKKVLPGNVIAGGLFHQISTNTTDYWGDVLYEKDKSLTVLFDGGYVVIDKDSTLSWHYYEKDHLGSNRIVMDDQGNMEQVNHYYPFGNSFGECNNSDKGSEVQRYKFNGKEQDLVHNLNLYDYGARMYDSQLGSWTSVDPLAEKYYNVSPYVYCMNNPINIIDTDGRRIQTLLFQNNLSPCWFKSTFYIHKALSYFAKTKFGRQLFADFTPKGSYFMGIKGNGKYANFDFTLYEISDENVESRTAYFNGVNAQSRLKKNYDGKPKFEVIFDTERNFEELLETVSHELAGHMYNYSEVLDAYKKNGNFFDAQKIWKNNSEEKEHKEMKDTRKKESNKYQLVIKELLEMYPDFMKKEKQNKPMNKNIYIKTILFILCACINSCWQKNTRTLFFYPSVPIVSYEVKYKDNSIEIEANYKKGTKTGKQKWILTKKAGKYFIEDQGQSLLFLSNKRELDTIIKKEPYLPKHIIIKSLNDSLFVSSLNRIVVNESFEIEIVYDRNYDIKQIRHQTLWENYVPTNKAPINNVPLLYEYGTSNHSSDRGTLKDSKI